MSETTAGALRERLLIRSVSTTIDSSGEPIATWADYLTVWGRCEFLSGRELEGMQKVNEAISVKMTVRYRTDITETMRVTWRSSVWNIHSILPNERKDYMALLVGREE